MTTPRHDARHYTYSVTWSDEDGEFVATVAEFPFLSWLTDSPADSLAGLEGVVREVLDDMYANGEDVPAPYSLRSYSGKFNVRIGESLHRQLALDAAREGLSLNQYVLRKLAA